GAHKVLCLRGMITHGHLPEASNFGGCDSPGTACASLPKKVGPLVSNITMSNFTYGVADLGVVGAMGIPRVTVNKPVTFFNADSAADIWHTVTGCAAPCDGLTGLDYPLANGPPGPGEFDPGPVTPEQHRIMTMAEEATEEARRRFGMTRREFVRTAAAYTIGLWAIDQVRGTEWGGYTAFAHNTKTWNACDLEWPHAQ